MVWPIYALHEFIILDNSVRLIYFHVCFSVFPSCVHNCCVMDHTYHSHKSFVLPHLDRHLSSGMLTDLFSGICSPILGHIECLLVLIVPLTHTPLCLAKFQLIWHCYKNCLDRRDDFFPSFYPKVIILCSPTSFPQLNILPCYRYNPRLPHTPFSVVLHNNKPLS